MTSSATLFMGGIRPLPPENRPTGIFKAEIVMPAWIGMEGLTGDAQADRRVHGGPDKALHQYPVAHYARLALAFPETSVEPGCVFELIDRMRPEVTVKELLAVWGSHRPDPAHLERLAATPGLAENWIRKLLDRAARLRTLDGS